MAKQKVKYYQIWAPMEFKKAIKLRQAQEPNKKIIDILEDMAKEEKARSKKRDIWPRF